PSLMAGKPEWAGNKGGKEKASSSYQMKQSVDKVKKDKKAKSSKADKDRKNNLFSDGERAAIDDYYDRQAASDTGKYKGKKKALPKGLQKKLERGGELPPGWQKKLERGEVLDPTLKAASEPLPEELLSRLPMQDQATEILKIRDKIVRVVKGQGTVVDIIDLAEIAMGGKR
ncbi:MAG: hypothetical protein OQK12_02960, partial [Motiliproteus sp.]|nr:hypothetical protein [Motiliproteus sp.]